MESCVCAIQHRTADLGYAKRMRLGDILQNVDLNGGHATFIPNSVLLLIDVHGYGIVSKRA